MTYAAGSGAATTRRTSGWLCTAVDFGVTVLLWAYFTLGFVIFFGPLYVGGALFCPGRRRFFQWINHVFYRGFFVLCRVLAPLQTWRIDPAVRAIRSAVIVCNHISYIDSILLISLFAHHTTIAKNRLFRMPILGRVLTLSGYLPASSGGRSAALMVERLEAMPAHLAAAGT